MGLIFADGLIQCRLGTGKREKFVLKKKNKTKYGSLQKQRQPDAGAAEAKCRPRERA